MKLLLSLAAAVVVIGIALVVARQIRRENQSTQALEAGLAAFERQDYAEVARYFPVYLQRKPNDIGILRKYAESLVSIKPLDAQAISGAISAYRRIIQLDPGDGAAAEALATLYIAIGNVEELAAVAKVRLEQDPNDLNAPLWLAGAMVQANKASEAREVLDAFIRRVETLPGRHVEYVQACAQMSALVAAEIPSRQEGASENGTTAKPQVDAVDDAAAGQPTPLDWLNRAVAYAPNSAEALVYRARFYRLAADAPEMNDRDKVTLQSQARQDLEAADHLGTDDRRIRHILGVEWMLHGELDRAAGELQAADRLPKETLREHFFNVSDWMVQRFLLGCELAMRRGLPVEAAALADETLASLDPKEKGYRGVMIPSAVRAYVAAGRGSEAKRCLDDYLTLVQEQHVKAAPARAIAALKALVEAAENRPYGVIDLLQPLTGSDPNSPQMLLLLAHAYSRTGQAGRAVNALEQYRRLNPQDRQAARELARQYAGMGDFERAFAVAGEAESLDPADVDLRLLRIAAGISRAIGRGQGTDVSSLKTLSEELAGLRQQHRDRVGIRVLQAIVAASLDRSEEAERELKQAIAECSDPLRAEIQLIRHYVGAQRVNDALAVCEASCARRKDIAEPWLMLSDLHAMKQDYDAARSGLRRGLEWVKENPARKLLTTKLGLLELTYGNRAVGIGALKEVARDPYEIQARLLLLGSREIREDPNESARLIGELRGAEGENGLWWRLYQATFWLSGKDATARQQEAVSLLRYCINADPAWPTPILVLGRMYAAQGDFKQAEDTYRRGLLGNPSATGVADALLNLLVAQNRFTEAEKVLRQIQNPQVANDWRVRLWIDTGEFSRAIDELRLRISNDKQDAVSRIELARLTYQETKNVAQAMQYLDEAKAITPESRTLAAVRASILRGEGRPAEALQTLDDYVAGYGSFEAYWMRAMYLAEGDEPERAEADYRKLTTFEDRATAGYELLADFFARTERLDQAIATDNEGLLAHPEDIRLKRSLMRHLFDRNLPGDRTAALEILDDLKRKKPGDSALEFEEALQKIEEGNAASLAEARTILEGVIKREPTAVNAHLALIRISVQQRQYQTASDLAVRGLGSNPNNVRLLLAWARAELALGYAPMAAKLARQALQQDRSRPDRDRIEAIAVEAIDVFLQAALDSGEQALVDEARTTIDSAVLRSPSHEQLLLLKARFCVAVGRPQAGIPELEAYCRTEQGGVSVTAIVTLADLHRVARNAARADEEIKRAEQLDPQNQAVVHARFLWLLDRQRFDDLRQISSRYIKAANQEPATVLRAGAMLMSLDPPELKTEGIRLFQHAVSLWPTLTDARLGLASALYQVGDIEGAERAYREVLQQDPGNAGALNDLAWILQERYQRYDEALALAGKGLAAVDKTAGPASGHVHLLDTKGVILTKMPDRLAEAKSVFEEILGILASSRRPADPHREGKTCLQLGRICMKLGDSAEAARYVKRAQEIDRKHNVLTDEERVEIGRLIEELANQPAPAVEDPNVDR